MATKSKGFIKMEWTCPNCNTRNPGPVKTCQSCGAPQPENVKFEMGADQNIVKDEKEIEQAKKGADIHCGFCGTRNPADAKSCSQCGGDLKEGMKRQAGQQIDRSATKAEPFKCLSCGFMNPISTGNCAQCGAPLGTKAAPPPTPPAKGLSRNAKIGIGAAAAAFVLICGAVIALFMVPAKSVDATVDAVHWQAVANVEEMESVRYNDKSGSPPSGAYDVSCRDESQEVCEEKSIDTGTGYAEVIEECHTETTTYCSYTVDEWTVIQSYTTEGDDLFPVWENPSMASDQRRGQDTATYTVYFVSAEEDYTYNPGTLEEYKQYDVGSEWSLSMNALGGIVGVEPAK